MNIYSIWPLLICFSALAEESNLPAPKLDNEQQNYTKNQDVVEKRGPWFRTPEEWAANRSVRSGLSPEPTTKLSTNGKRWDVTAGKRIPVIAFANAHTFSSWYLAAEGGMQASLTHETSKSAQVFGTENFDGFFGASLNHLSPEGAILMARVAHLSAHQVDNSPSIDTPMLYSQFWYDFTFGQIFPNPAELTRWDLAIQVSLGQNFHALPQSDSARFGAGLTGGVNFSGPDSLAFIFSGDLYHTGVIGQKMNYNGFLGLGFLNRAYSTHRPLRAGLSWYAGADHRNSFYWRHENFMCFEVQTDF